MYDITIPGYPRIGEKRELKKFIESYLSQTIDEKTLIENCNNLLKKQLGFLSSKISIVPINDFSLYDNMLDTAFLFGIYKPKNSLSLIETYFAYAKGIRKNKTLIKPLIMKKWFNTNYHYLVPEISNLSNLSLNTKIIADKIKIAKDIKKDLKFVIIGPLTFLKLSIIKNSQKILPYRLAEQYLNLIEYLQKQNIKYIQFDEPILTTSLSNKDIKLFKDIYNIILNNNCKIKTILQAYFGSVCDKIKILFSIPFDSYGFDFVEGFKDYDYILKHGFPKEKQLIAGIVNGRNIWINNYEKSIDIVKNIEKKLKIEKLLLSTSTPLLFIPYTIKKEKNSKLLNFFAFANEKLDELNDLVYLLKSNNYKKEKIFLKNKNKIRKIFSQYKIEKQIKLSKYKRNIPYSKRKKIQDKLLNLPLLPITTIGSFPQDKNLRKIRKLYKDKSISKKEYESFIKNKIKQLIETQEKLNLDVFVHGEYERNDMVQYFAENLKGFYITNNGWVQSYGTRVVKPPIIIGNIQRKKKITIKWIKYAQSLTTKPVKAILTGPITIYNWSFPNEYLSFEQTVLQIAKAIKEEINDLEKSGVKIIQIDEAAILEKIPLKGNIDKKNYLDFSANVFNFIQSDVSPSTQIHTHLCYSKISDYINFIKTLDADVTTIEASKQIKEVAASIKKANFKNSIGPGVYDVHSTLIPTSKEIEEKINILLKYIPASKLWINPDCGLKTRNEYEVMESLKNIVEAVKKIRKKIK